MFKGLQFFPSIKLFAVFCQFLYAFLLQIKVCKVIHVVAVCFGSLQLFHEGFPFRTNLLKTWGWELLRSICIKQYLIAHWTFSPCIFVPPWSPTWWLDDLSKGRDLWKEQQLPNSDWLTYKTGSDVPTDKTHQ